MRNRQADMRMALPPTAAGNVGSGWGRNTRPYFTYGLGAKARDILADDTVLLERVSVDMLPRDMADILEQKLASRLDSKVVRGGTTQNTRPSLSMEPAKAQPSPASKLEVELRALRAKLAAQVRKTPGWPRSWANSSPL